MTRFEELKAKHDKKLITIDEALELLGIYQSENDYLSNLVAIYQKAPQSLSIPMPLKMPYKEITCLGLGFLVAKMME
jgi:hypothetical protein